jgi:crotonobetainyl-CoA:carnitine CoA-transferase CaiB-like acyl-CoA transferase
MSALAGIHVLDFTRVVSGPYCTMVLSDLGADVIKVERPETGDDSRAFGPPFAGGESTYFLAINRGKRSVVIDLATEEGRQHARHLARLSDVVVENFRVGYMASIGLDYDALAKDHPGLVYCAMTSFGEVGPYKDRAGYDVMVSALGGMMSITGHREGPPAKTGVALLDVATGLHAATAICAALFERERSGVGQHIELSLLGVQLSTLINAGSAYLVAGEVMGPQGNAHFSIAPYGAFLAADGYVVIGAANDRMFARLCQVLGAPGLISDPRFNTNAHRVGHRNELDAVIGELISRARVSEWVERIGGAGVAVAPVNMIDEVFADPQVIASGQVGTFAHATLGDIQLVGSPIHLSRTPVEPKGAPPTLGQHTHEVLGDLRNIGPGFHTAEGE